MKTCCLLKRSKGAVTAFRASGNALVVEGLAAGRQGYRFEFDRLFGSVDKRGALFAEFVRPAVDGALNGSNALVFLFDALGEEL